MRHWLTTSVILTPLIAATILVGAAHSEDADPGTAPGAPDNVSGLYEHEGSVVNISGGRGNFSGRLESVSPALAERGYQTGDRLAIIQVPHQVVIPPSTDDAGLPGGVLTSGQHGEYLEKFPKCPEQWGKYDFRVASGSDPAQVASISGVVTYQKYEKRYERAYHRLKRPVPFPGIVGKVDWVAQLVAAIAEAGDHGDPQDCVPGDDSETATAAFTRIDENRAAEIAKANAPPDKTQSAANGDTGNRPPPTNQKPPRGRDPPTGRPTTSRDPVLLHSGEFVIAQTDVVVPGRGLDWSFTRTYRSQRHVLTTVGWGWTDDAMPALIRSAAGWSFRGPDGGWIDMEPLEDGLFGTRLGHRLRIGKDERLFRDLDGTLYRFAPLPGGPDRSRITVIEDGAGNRLTYRTDLLGRVVEVIDTLGRSATYRYDDKTGALTEVVAPDGQRVALVHDDAGDLVAVRIFAAGSDTPASELRYAYGRNADHPELDHVITQAWSPSDHGTPSLELAYGSSPTAPDFGRVAVQRAGAVVERFSYRTLNGEADSAALETTVESDGQAANIYRFDARGLELAHIERAPDGHERRWEQRYDADGLLIHAMRPRGDGTLVHRDAAGLPIGVTFEPASGSTEQPVSYVVSYEPIFHRLKSISGPFGGDVPTDPALIKAHTVFRADFDYEGAAPPDWVAQLGLARSGSGSEQRQWLGQPIRVSVPGSAPANGAAPTEAVTTLSWDKTGLLLEVRRPWGTLIRLEYQKGTDGTPAWISRIYSPASNGVDRVILSRQSDEWGRLIFISHSGGVPVGIVNDGLGRPVEIVPQDALAPHRRLEYDASGRVVREIDVFPGPNSRADTIAEYQWDGAGSLAKETRYADPKAPLSTDYERDPYGKVTAIADAGGRISHRYDAFGRLVTVTVEGTGEHFTYEYDDGDNLVAETDAAGNSWRYGYDGFGRVREVTDPTGRTVAIRRDLAGDPVEYQFAEGAGKPALLVLGIERDAIGRVLAQWRGRIEQEKPVPVERQTFDRDPTGRLVAIHYPDGSRTSVQYDPYGETSGFEENGTLFAIARDLAGFVGAVYVNREPLLRLIYDPAGRLTEALARDYDARIDRDLVAGTTSARFFAGREQGSPALGRATSHSDWLGRLLEERAETFDGEKWEVTDDIKYQWDATSRLIGVWQRGLQSAQLDYDAAGRPTKEQYFGQFVREIQYDPAHATAVATDGRGVRVERRFDGLGRVVERSATLPGANAAAEVDQFSYHPFGRLAGHARGSWSTQYSYDFSGRAIEDIVTHGAERYSIGREYTERGDLIRRSLPSRLVIDFSAATDDQLTMTLGSETFVAHYDAGGALIGLDWRRVHVTQTRTVTPTALEEERLSVAGPAGPMLAQTLRRRNGVIVEVAEGANTSRFIRDESGRIASGAVVLPDARRTISAYSFEVAYDSHGNRIRYRLGDQILTAKTDGEWRLTSIGSATIEYDGAGDVSKLGPVTFEYDAAGRISSVTNSATGVRIEYVRDALGRVVERRSGGNTRRYFWDGFMLIGELENGAWLRSYVWDRAGNLVAIATPNSLSLVIRDGSGNVVALVDGDGNILQRVYYDAYGSTRAVDASGGAVLPSSGLLFAGMLYDPDAELYLTANRTYAPGMGRFLEPDPLGPIATAHPYAYAADDPITYRDPLGLQIAPPPTGDPNTANPIRKVGKAYDKASGGVGKVGDKIDQAGKKKPGEQTDPTPKKQIPLKDNPTPRRDAKPTANDPYRKFREAGAVAGEAAGQIGDLVKPADPKEAGAIMGEGAGSVRAVFNLAPAPSSGGPDLSTLIGDAGDGRWTYLSDPGPFRTAPRDIDLNRARPSIGPELFSDLGLDGGTGSFGSGVPSSTAGQPIGGVPPSAWVTPFSPSSRPDPLGDLLFAPGARGETRGQAYDGYARARDLGLQLGRGPVM